MNQNLSKTEVLNLLRIWENWMKGTEPSKNKLKEFTSWDERVPRGMKFVFGILLHQFLWSITKTGFIFGSAALVIWASKARIKYDYWWWEPVSCGLNNSYSDLGLGYLKAGRIMEAIECLAKSWKVFPCPHNTSFGLKTTLYTRLKNYLEAKEAVLEYSRLWKKFKRV